MVRVWAGVRVLVAGAAPHARAWLRARAQVAGFDAGYAPRGRAERADDARALLLGGGREALIARGVRHDAMSMCPFAVLLSYVVWPRHMMVRRATSVF